MAKPAAKMDLIVEDHGNSVVLRRAENLPVTTLEDLIGCAGYAGPSRSLKEMEAGVARGSSEEDPGP